MGELLEAEGESAPEAAIAGDGGAAVGLALDRARSRRGKADPIADRYLARQEELVAKQLHHLDEQFRHLRLKHFSERLKVTLQLLTILVGVLALVGVGWMAWSAAHDRGVVIEAFESPPDLAQQGLTGKALAVQLIDKLGALQQGTSSRDQAAQVREARAAEIKVQIPETGVSLGELNQALRQWLGHQTIISGELSHVPAGPQRGALALNVRIGDAPGARLVQPDGDAEALLQRGAEHVYGVTNPVRYAQWLDQHSRTPEAIAILQRLVARGDRRLYGPLGAMVGVSVPVEQLAEFYRISTAVSPHDSRSWANAGSHLRSRGFDEAGYRYALRARDEADNDKVTAAGRVVGRAIADQGVATSLGDWAGVLSAGCTRYGVSPCSPDALVLAIQGGGADGRRADNALANAGAQMAQAMALTHDVGDALRLTAMPRDDPPGRSAAFAASYHGVWIGADVLTALAREDWRGVVQAADRWDALAAQWPGLRYAAPHARWRAYALARLGDRAGAEVAIGPTPLNCYLCLRVRAATYEALGDHAAADRWFAEAVRQAPSIPFAYADWGRALLQRGQPDAAIAKLTLAHAKGPRYPDALELWGEALAAKGDAAGAAAKFVETAPLAPRWGRLRLKWGEALARQGKTKDASAQFAAAAALDLTAAERAELAAQRT